MGASQSGLGLRDKVMRYTEETEAPEEDNYDGIKDVHALIVHVDYGWPSAKKTGWCPAGFGDKLDTPENAEMMKNILVKAGITSIKEISNMNATRDHVLAAIEEVGNKCDEDDVFFFFYSGHGDEVPDHDGDEEDGMDEAMCLPDRDGNVNADTYLRDDDIAVAFSEITAGSKMLVFDCCHSGTICDFEKEMWSGQKAISICGCRDDQEAAAMGGGTRGGAFTKMIKAACEFHAGTEHSVGKIFNCAAEYKGTFVPPGHHQDLVMACAPGMDSSNMAWPATLPDANGHVTKRQCKDGESN